MVKDASIGKLTIQSEKLLVEYGEAVDAAIARGVRDALLQHKRAGNPVAVWRGGQVVLLQPEEILPEAEESK